MTFVKAGSVPEGLVRGREQNGTISQAAMIDFIEGLFVLHCTALHASCFACAVSAVPTVWADLGLSTSCSQASCAQLSTSW